MFYCHLLMADTTVTPMDRKSISKNIGKRESFSLPLPKRAPRPNELKMAFRLQDNMQTFQNLNDFEKLIILKECHAFIIGYLTRDLPFDKAVEIIKDLRKELVAPDHSLLIPPILDFLNGVISLRA